MAPLTKTIRRLAAGGLALALATAARAQASEWTWALTPYLWLPNVSGTLNHGRPPGGAGSPEIETGPNDYLEHLSGVLMLSGEARRGAWAVYTDFIYLDFDAERSRVRNIEFGAGRVPVGGTLDAGTETSLSGIAWTLGLSRALVDDGSARFELLGGLRYLTVEATSEWRLTATIDGPGGGASFPASGRIESDTELWDAIVGMRGHLRFGSGNWSMPYYVDVGAGSSKLTWQAMLGVAYRFGWGDLLLAYRHLSYDQDADKLMQDYRFSGPALGATFRF